VQRHGGAFAVEGHQLGLVSSGGRVLPDAVCSKMETMLGADFSNVRVHVGPQAERIGAIAFTVGSDIYFAPGRYQPNTMQGQQLLGHELAHVVQQREGRVRNPLGSGLAVVQDHALEAEADRLGRLAGAMPQRALLQPKTVRFRVGPPKPAWDGTHRSISPKAAATVQRRIWKHNGAKWALFEVGSAGAYGDPEFLKLDPEKGPFYNDISGKQGGTIKDVRAGLADLLLVTGALKDLPNEVAWPDSLWDGLNETAKRKAAARRADDAVLNVGRVTIDNGAQDSFALDKDDKTYVTEELLKRTWNTFLSPFMKANGQYAYIERKKWFKEGAASIIIDINFYYNRGADRSFAFHKDTGADNLFVNLIFNNKEEILATEWTEDLEADTPKKVDALKLNLPDAEIARIDKARAGFKQPVGPYKLEHQGTVRGDVARGKATYVSWVDELVWHSTPAPLSRTGYYRKILKPKHYWRYKPYAVDALRILWKSNARRRLADSKAKRDLKTFTQFCWNRRVQWHKAWNALDAEKRDDMIDAEATKITTKMCDDYMNTVETANGEKGVNFAAHKSEINAIAQYSRQNDLVTGQDIDKDEFAMTTEFHNKDTGITPTIRRQNSFRANRISKIGDEPRSFIRTWVRVHRKDTRTT
jgi:Domain of unknown function (DUF4157)